MDQTWSYPGTQLGADDVRLSLGAAKLNGHAMRLRLGGELDLATADRLTGWVRGLQLDTRRLVILDLSGLTFCDARGLRAIRTIDQSLRADGRRLRLRNVPAPLRRVMAITGDDSELDIA